MGAAFVALCGGDHRFWPLHGFGEIAGLWLPFALVGCDRTDGSSATPGIENRRVEPARERRACRQIDRRPATGRSGPERAGTCSTTSCRCSEGSVSSCACKTRRRHLEELERMMPVEAERRRKANQQAAPSRQEALYQQREGRTQSRRSGRSGRDSAPLGWTARRDDGVRTREARVSQHRGLGRAPFA